MNLNKLGWIAAILFFAFFLRIIFINEVPPGPAFDEIQLIVNSVSLLKTGQPIPGSVTGIIGPASGYFEPGIFSELGAYLLVPWLAIFGFSWFTVKIPFILTSLGMILFVYLITKKLVNEKCGLVAALMFAINPWSIHLGRTAYESLFSYFFYLVVIYLFIVLKGWRFLLALPFLLLGFLTYFASKTQPLPLLGAGLLANFLYHTKDFKKLLAPRVLLLVVTVVLFVSYMMVLVNLPAGYRLNETKSSLDYGEIVNQKRRISLNSPVGNLFENKLIEQIKERLISSLDVLSPNFLFIQGPTGGTETLIIPDHGPMYLIDLIFIVIGLGFLARKYPKALIYLLALLTVAMIPNAARLSLKQYILRDGLLFPLLTIISASGVYFLLNAKLKRNLRVLLVGSIFAVFLVSFIYFLNQYFYRMPVQANEGWNLQNRILAKYLKLSSQLYPEQKYTAIVNDINGVSAIYLLLSDSYKTKEQIQKVNASLANFNFQFGNVKFLTECPKDILKEDTLIVDHRFDCKVGLESNSQIASPKDGGGKYFIYNDKLCTQGKKRYPKLQDFQNLNIEKYNQTDLCSNWVTNPRLPI